MLFAQLAEKNQLHFKSGSINGTSGVAVFNTSCTNRYFLEKRWEQGENILTAIMMNPSKASHNETDDTVDQLISVAETQNCHALFVVNVSSHIQGTSSKTKVSHFDYEAINWLFVSNAILEAKMVFLGWGMKGQKGINKQQKLYPAIVNTFKTSIDKLYSYEVLKSEDKKFIENPIFYVPHPRPQGQKDKYANISIQNISSDEFNCLFVR
ncbi:uncharacterized protein DUF1643 [Paenibacillus pabuli]|uniref:Uncharacterized protein DUF1643 n=1 Tax=Paenibacillus pabuli TaxID=1472 RepID=A0ABX9BBI4_9BACL|nr:DUF1643 domain-containing protein [Paenibacillus pabuli]RAI84433.1 uncharacterized protein DUF1643 [Paenibacillus pabuli]